MQFKMHTQLLHDVIKRQAGTLSKAVSLPLGKHTIRVNLKSSPERFDQTRQIAVERRLNAA